ncbi:SseB family protein [Rhodopseudomonas palustris]|uniref:SseB family protein n=1 Tax=Thiospirillum jenense TaxID=1653858 RepID=A0A839HEI5_9GAMM|nr:SseB family protein [Thiospirillum jenense]MBB1093593.1 SseB family protein [Rhodopseudomonas palustris]MBB1127273.1 SseB family protein [Thiospirillum jenense]
MTTADFHPQNELERQLLAAQNGEIAPEALIQFLIESDVFMPIYDQHTIGGLQTTQRAQPLTINQDDGGKVLILFTSPDRAKTFVRDFPGYGGGLVVTLRWILDHFGIGFAISLNPDQLVGMDFEAHAVAQLATQINTH